MIKNENPFMTEKERIALAMNQDGNALIMDMKGTTAEDVIKEETIKKINKEMEIYADTFNNHVQKLEESVNKLSLNPENLEIMPIGNYVIVKEFSTNPFQRIKRDSKTGLITDLGGMAPVFQNTDSGETDIEDAFVLTGNVVEVGPDCKWVKEGDAVMFTKPSQVPLPFFKVGLSLVNETRILAVINEGLSQRFEEIKNQQNAEFIDISELPDFLGDTIEDKLEGYISWKKRGFKLIEKCQEN